MLAKDNTNLNLLKMEKEQNETKINDNDKKIQECKANVEKVEQ